ncbi:MAG: hypothetical protein QF475_02875 [Candidatus Undinarchaeales archaeon]|jgi:hypothetical protein|nr:hypothetical protein [Candidatus Undinarchaeales archaeon]|tara:strand:+ start:379 stop:606 length:228 start_codon:yes stop_codon:yes gene_type:complete
MTKLLVFTVGIPLIVFGIVYILYPEKMFNFDRGTIHKRNRGETPEMDSTWIENAKKKGMIFSAVGLLVSIFFWFY